jgi:hypothetical protein
MDITINWRAPFELAFELALFLLGSVAVLLVVLLTVTIVYGIVRAFLLAMRTAVSRRPQGGRSENHPAGRALKPVK